MADNENRIEGKVRQLSLFQETCFSRIDTWLLRLLKTTFSGEIWTQPNADKSVSLKLLFFLLKFDKFFHQRIENSVRFTPYNLFAKILIQTTDRLVSQPRVFQASYVFSYSTINGIFIHHTSENISSSSNRSNGNAKHFHFRHLEKHSGTIKPNSRYFFQSVITKPKSIFVAPALYLVNGAAISPLKVISTKPN